MQHPAEILKRVADADSINLYHLIIKFLISRRNYRNSIDLALILKIKSKNQTPPPAHPCDTSTKQCLLLSEQSARVLAVPVLIYAEVKISEVLKQPVRVMQAGAREELCSPAGCGFIYII